MKFGKIILVTLILFNFHGCAPKGNQIVKGADVDLTGEISDTPWQHMIDIPKKYPYADYFDLDDGDQLVIYTKLPVDCTGEMRLNGKIIEIKGTSKRPGSDEKYTEPQILVDEFECL
jgi:hypothetical protein